MIAEVELLFQQASLKVPLGPVASLAVAFDGPHECPGHWVASSRSRQRFYANLVSEAASFLNVARTIVGQPLDHIRQAIDEFGAGLMANVIRSQTSSGSASAQIHRIHSKCMVGFMRLRSQIMQRLQIVA